MQFIAVKEWSRYQHYKDRNPPWIKLHRELLTSNTWVTMDDASRVLAIAIMLLAAATGNRIPADPAYLTRVAYLNRKPDWSKLLSVGFIEIIGDVDEASNTLASASTPQADARPETEQRQRREEKSTFVRFWKAYPRKQDKGHAERAFDRAIKDTDPERIIAACENYRWPEDRQFIPMPATWLNGRRWEDEQNSAPEPQADPAASQWRARLKNYKPGGYWPEIWGERPGEPGCLVPALLLKEFSLTTPNPKARRG
jgi:hypothetical protein